MQPQLLYLPVFILLNMAMEPQPTKRWLGLVAGHGRGLSGMLLFQFILSSLAKSIYSARLSTPRTTRSQRQQLPSGTFAASSTTPGMMFP